MADIQIPDIQISDLPGRTTPAGTDLMHVEASGADYKAELSALVNAVTDAAPTENSPAPVSSGGLYTLLSGIGDNIDGIIRAMHNIPRAEPKDLSPYVADGTLWKRIAGTDGFSVMDDIFAGDYIHMSRAISAYERTGTYQETGSEYVSVADIDGAWNRGDTDPINYHHLIMVPGKGFDPTEKQHFGRARMNATNTTVGGYLSSEMNTTTIGAVATSFVTGSNLSINQQLFNEFGNHLKTVRESLSSSINASGYNRFGNSDGCSDDWSWTSVQAVLMSEIEVYGSIVWSSSGYDAGTGCSELALFRHSEIARNNRTAYYWLKDVASKNYFCDSSSLGFARFFDPAAASYYVRPRFIIGA